MARFFVPVDRWDSGLLPESEARHAAQVLRLGSGDRAVIFDGAGRAADVELENAGKKHAGFRVLREWREERPRPEIHLIAALIKNERFDWLVQKATELGAASIRPVAAGRSVVKLGGKDAEKRRAKWTQVAVEAAKQCGHLVLPEIFSVARAEDAFRDSPEGLKGIPAIHAKGAMLGNFFAGTPGNVTFAIGPEGDWTDDEMAAAQAAGFVPLDLGRHVLRSETAALYALGAAAHHFLGGVGGMA
ncbi:MAG: 16S rRNA (uracil(1498)-N(3))-methyltransferase [Chthoniobacterales bacterium]|nr:16S rRNA (uracil(1498)-N(3))-methyltransferase [Chthoniobacterales bacterium]